MKIAATRNILNRLRRILKGMLFTASILAAFLVVLAFTTVPFWIWYGMGVKHAGIKRPPDCIVLLGGGGMPSESALMRLWYTAQAGNYFNKANIIIALPGNAKDSLSSINLMKKELILHGISKERIFLEDSGTNTRAQALRVLKIISNIEQRISNIERKNVKPDSIQYSKFNIRNSKFTSILIVTSPEHMLRAVLTFKKAGFMKVDGLPAFEQAIAADITFNARKLGGQIFIPDVGNSIMLRYQFWTQLQYEILILREYTALAYYKVSGWI